MTTPNKCGCRVVEKDGRKLFMPCVPCGLFRAAQAISKARRWWRRGKHLEDAAQALAAVATTVQREQQRANLSKAVADALAAEKGEEDA